MNIQELKLKTSEQLITQAEELSIEKLRRTSSVCGNVPFVVSSVPLFLKSCVPLSLKYYATCVESWR